MGKTEERRERHTCTKCHKKREEQFMTWEKGYNNGGHWHCKDCEEDNRNYGHPNRIKHEYDC